MAIVAAVGMGHFIVVSLNNGHDLCSVRLRLVPSKLQVNDLQKCCTYIHDYYNKPAFEQALIQITLALMPLTPK